MAGIDFTRREEIAVPDREGRMAVRNADWVRIRRCIRRIQRPILPSLAVWYSVLFGVGGSAALTVVPLNWAQGLPAWVIPSYVVVAVAATVLGAILVFLDHRLQKNRTGQADELDTDLDEIEKLFKAQEGSSEQGGAA